MKVSIGVSTYNSASTMKACVESLLATDYPDKEIIIVDDGSKDDTLKILQNYPIQLIHQNHGGVSAGRDNVFRHATGDIVAYTDSDCEVDKQWITELIKPFADPQIGAATGRTIFCTDHRCTSWIRSLDIEERYNQRKTSTGLANGTNCAFRKIILEEIGGFNPNWFHAEDTEVSYRILQKGLKIYYQQSAIVRHVPEGNWKSYLRKRYRGTKAHLRIMPKFTKDVLADDFVSKKMVVQPILYTGFLTGIFLSLLCLIPGFIGFSGFFSLSCIILLLSLVGLGSGFILEIPLIIKIVFRSKNIFFLFISIFMLLAKSVAIGAGVYAGLLEYRMFSIKERKS